MPQVAEPSNAELFSMMPLLSINLHSNSHYKSVKQCYQNLTASGALCGLTSHNRYILHALATEAQNTGLKPFVLTIMYSWEGLVGTTLSHEILCYKQQLCKCSMQLQQLQR